MGIRAASPTPRELPLSNQTRFRWARRILSDGMLWQLRADHEQKQELGDATITQGLDATRPITEALQKLWGGRRGVAPSSPETTDGVPHATAE